MQWDWCPLQEEDIRAQTGAVGKCPLNRIITRIQTKGRSLDPSHTLRRSQSCQHLDVSPPPLVSGMERVNLGHLSYPGCAASWQP